MRKGSAEFLLFTYLICLASVGFLVFKASCYDYAQDQRVYSHFQGFGAVLMLINVGFAALHVFCAKTFDLLQGRRRRLQLVTSPGARSGAAAAEPEWGGGRWGGRVGKAPRHAGEPAGGVQGSAAAAGLRMRTRRPSSTAGTGAAGPGPAWSPLRRVWGATRPPSPTGPSASPLPCPARRGSTTPPTTSLTESPAATATLT